MNILFWYLPFTMFTGACDLLTSEGDMHLDAEPSAEGVESRPFEEPARTEQALGSMPN
jgi:hypothetical protein